MDKDQETAADRQGVVANAPPIAGCPLAQPDVMRTEAGCASASATCDAKPLPQRCRLEPIDMLRGVACVCMVVSHLHGVLVCSTTVCMTGRHTTHTTIAPPNRQQHNDTGTTLSPLQCVNGP